VRIELIPSQSQIYLAIRIVESTADVGAATMLAETADE
jgi:hypothetical protein